MQNWLKKLQMEKLKKTQLYSLLIILLILVPVAGINFYIHVQQEKIKEQQRVCNSMRDTLVQNTLTPALQKVQAKSLFVYDFTRGVKIAGKNDDLSSPLASLTKIMTVRTALKNTPPHEFYTVQKQDLLSDGFFGFVSGDSYRISELVTAALVSSVNHAAVMLSRSTGMSESSFVEKMNSDAQELGLKTLRFGNPTGLDIDDTVATAFGSAHDVLFLLHNNYLDFPEYSAVSTKTNVMIKSSSGRSILLKNTNPLVDSLPLLLASKTGYTDTAGGNLAIIWREPGNNILGAVVLGSSELGRFDDMKAIHDSASTYVSAARSLPSYCNFK